jgi:hypothetical protein
VNLPTLEKDAMTPGPPVLLRCALLAASLSGCVTHVIEVRPVAPVVELPAAPVYPNAAATPRTPAGGARAEPAGKPGGEVEAVIPGMSSGRSLSIERVPDQR